MRFIRDDGGRAAAGTRAKLVIAFAAQSQSQSLPSCPISKCHFGDFRKRQNENCVLNFVALLSVLTLLLLGARFSIRDSDIEYGYVARR
jgi:hypothetical protein